MLKRDREDREEVLAGEVALRQHFSAQLYAPASSGHAADGSGRTGRLV